MTDLTMKGTKGRDCSPRYYQRGSYGGGGQAKKVPSKPPRGVSYTGVGTPLGGTAPEASGKLSPAQGVLDPSLFNVDGHAVRAFSRYWEGKRSGPDWLHRRVEQAQQERLAEGLELGRRS